MSCELAKLINIPDKELLGFKSMYDEEFPIWKSINDLENSTQSMKILAGSLNALPSIKHESYLESLRVIENPDFYGVQAVLYLPNPPLLLDNTSYKVLDVEKVFNSQLNLRPASIQSDYRNTPSLFEIEPIQLLPFTTASHIDDLAIRPNRFLLEILEPVLVTQMSARPFGIFDKYVDDDIADPLCGEDSNRVLVFAQIQPLLPPLYELINHAEKGAINMDEETLMKYVNLRNYFIAKKRQKKYSN